MDSCQHVFINYQCEKCRVGQDVGFGFAPTPDDFQAAHDVLEWRIWGPY